VGDQTFIEKVLPVESVAEYFEPFPVLEIDFTSYTCGAVVGQIRLIGVI
jgi:hypothetical protein